MRPGFGANFDATCFRSARSAHNDSIPGIKRFAKVPDTHAVLYYAFGHILFQNTIAVHYSAVIVDANRGIIAHQRSTILALTRHRGLLGVLADDDFVRVVWTSHICFGSA